MAVAWLVARTSDIPTDAYCKGAVSKVAALDDGHLAAEEGSWAIQNLVRVAMIDSIMGV